MKVQYSQPKPFTLPRKVMKVQGRNSTFVINENGEVFDQRNNPVQLQVMSDRPYVNYCVNGLWYKRRLDYIVAENFLAKPIGEVRLIHKDGDNFNCAYSNLTWITQADIINRYKDEFGMDDSILMHESWRLIDSPAGKLEVSSFGRIRYYGKSELIKCHDNQGYWTIYYTDPNDAHRTKHLLVHRLVAQAFIPNPENYGIVNHLDGNKHNCKVSNLEWCSKAMNTEHGMIVNGGLKRITNDSLDQVGKMLQNGVPHVLIEQATGVNRKVISDIYRGRRHPEIAAKYHFVAKKWNKDIALKMVDLINQGYRGKEVITKLGYPYDQSSISFYERVRREYKNQIKK